MKRVLIELSVVMLLIGACVCLYKRSERYHQAAERHSGNVEALTGEVERYRAFGDSIEVASARLLELRSAEFERLFEEQAAEIRALRGVRHPVRYAEMEVVVRDTVRVGTWSSGPLPPAPSGPPSVPPRGETRTSPLPPPKEGEEERPPDPRRGEMGAYARGGGDRYFGYRDRYLTIDGVCGVDTTVIEYEQRIDLRMVEHQRRKRFLGFLWFTKRVELTKVDAWVDNPKAKVNSILIVKMD